MKKTKIKTIAIIALMALAVSALAGCSTMKGLLGLGSGTLVVVNEAGSGVANVTLKDGSGKSVWTQSNDSSISRIEAGETATFTGMPVGTFTVMAWSNNHSGVVIADGKITTLTLHSFGVFTASAPQDPPAVESATDPQ